MKVNKQLFTNNESDGAMKENTPPLLSNNYSDNGTGTPGRNTMRHSDTYVKLSETLNGRDIAHTRITSPKSTVLSFSPKYSDIMENGEECYSDDKNESSQSDNFEDSLMSKSVYENNKKPYFPNLNIENSFTPTTCSKDYCITTECEMTEKQVYDVSVDVSVCGASSVTVEVTSPCNKKSHRSKRSSGGLSLNNNITNGAHNNKESLGKRTH